MLLPDSLSLFGIYYTRRWALVAENRVSHRRTGPTRREDGAPAADIPASLPPCPSTCPGMLHTYIHVRVPGLQHVRHRDRSRPRLPPTHGSSPLLPSLPPPPPPNSSWRFDTETPGLSSAGQAHWRPTKGSGHGLSSHGRRTETHTRGNVGTVFHAHRRKNKNEKVRGKNATDFGMSNPDRMAKEARKTRN